MKPFEQFIFWIKLILLFIFLPFALRAQNNQIVNSGSQTAAVNFPVTTCTYNWTNSNPAIGLAANGSGDIPPFTATNATGNNTTATITVTPTQSSQPPLLYIPNFSDNNVSVINASTNALLTTIPLGPSANPYNVVISNDYNRVYVSNKGSNTVSVIYMPTNRLYATVTGFSNPGSIAISPNNDIAYVANTFSNTVSLISVFSNTIVSSITVGQHPLGLALTPITGNYLYVANGDGTLSIINTLNNSVNTTAPIMSDPASMLISPDGTKLYVVEEGGNKIDVISTASNTVIDNITVPSPRGIALSPDGSRLYIATTPLINGGVTVVNTVTNAPIGTITLGGGNSGLSISGDGSLLYATNVNTNKVSVISTALPLSQVGSVNVGSTPFSLGNFYLTRDDCIPQTFTITVNSATGPSITITGAPSAISTSYGTASLSSNFFVSGANMTAGILVTPPAGFEVSLNDVTFTNTVTISGTGTIASTRVYIRLKKTAAAGPYSGDIKLSSNGATDVNVSMAASNVSPAPVIISTIGSIPYGVTINDFQATTSNYNFGPLNSFLKNGETATTLDISFTGGNSPTDPAGTYTNVIVSSNLTGTNGFLPSNYAITYQTGSLVRSQALLTVKANNVNKIFGNTLTNTTASTDFTVTGLQNSETVTSLTITYGSGAAANAPLGTYIGAVTPSSLIGGNGFLASNYNITYSSGNVIVTAAQPAITAFGTLQPLTTVYGTPSSSTSFTVSATDLTAGILITPPAGFEVSTDNSVFSPTVTIGLTGNLSPTPVYIHLSPTAFVGGYSGNIILQTSGAAIVNKAMPNSTVTPAPLIINANSVSKVYGTTLTGGPGSIAYVASGLKNNEVVDRVTITYGTGSAAIAATGVYNASIMASAVTGGTFTLSNYSPTYQPGNLTVTPAPLTITADNKSKFYRDVNPAFTLTYSGFVNGDNATQLTTQPTATTTASQASLIGQYPITVGGGAAANYTFTYINGVLAVTAVPLGPITIPNTFTPNGDGINDIWNIANLDTYPKITVTIFNRYGIQVYFSNGYPVAWDGNYNGGKVPLGTYYYVITGVNTKPLKGYVAVIR